MKIVNNNKEIPEGQYVPHKVVKWYDRSVRSWVVAVEDKYGNQVGDSIHVYTKREATQEYNDLVELHGLSK